MSKLKLLVLAALLGGCWPPIPRNQIVESPPNVVEAIEICRSLYSSQLYEFPPFDTGIVWMEGACLDLDLNAYDKLLVETSGSDCLEGIYFPDHKGLYILTRAHLFQTALSHELMHYWSDVTTGSIDGSHTRDDWWVLPPIADDLIWEMEKAHPIDEENEPPHPLQDDPSQPDPNDPK